MPTPEVYGVHLTPLLITVCQCSRALGVDIITTIAVCLKFIPKHKKWRSVNSRAAKPRPI